MDTNKIEIVGIDVKNGYYNHSNDYRNIKFLIEEYNSQGYEVQSITPLTSGETSEERNTSGEEQQYYGFSFGYTSALLIVFKKMILE